MSRSNKLWNAFFVVCFLAILFLPLITMPLSSQSTIESEKRNPNPWPRWNELFSNTYPEFAAKFEEAFQDRFGMRVGMTRLYNRLLFHLDLMSFSRTLVAQGKGGWHFYASGGDEDTLQIYSGGLDFDDDELNRMTSALLAWQDWLAKKDIRFYYLLLPDKISVYSQYKPTYLSKNPSGTRTEKLSLSLEREGVNVINPLETLSILARHNDLLYFKWDTHWTWLGSYHAYLDTLRAITKDFSNLEAYKLPNYVFTESTRTGGDLVDLLGIGGNYSDHFIEVTADGAALPNFQETGSLEMGETVKVSWGDPSLPRAVIFHDSFMLSMGSYLAANFRETTFVFRDELEKQIIERENPDLVIFAQVERFAHQLLKQPFPE